MEKPVASAKGMQIPRCDNSEVPETGVVWKAAQGWGRVNRELCEQREVELIEGNAVLGPLGGAFLNPRPMGVVD